MVKMLLDHGAIPTCAVLHEAVRSWQDPSSSGGSSSSSSTTTCWRVMELLLDAGGPPTVDKALELAVAKHERDKEGLVHLLLGRATTTQVRRQAYMWAAGVGATGTLLLLQNEAMNSNWLEEAMEEAAHHGNVDALAHLVGAGADAESIDQALGLAIGTGQAAAVTWLLEHGADVHWFGDAPLRLAAIVRPQIANTMRMVEALLAHGADASLIACYILVQQATDGRHPLLLLLMQHGAAVDVADQVLVVKAILEGHTHTQAHRQQTAEQALQMLLKRHVHTRAAAKRLLALVQPPGC